MAFRVGQRVVCVDDDPSARYAPWKPQVSIGLDGLTRGHVYTVARIGTFRAVDCVWLREITRRPWGGFGEPGYAPARFRPATDISVFTAMLNRIKETA